MNNRALGRGLSALIPGASHSEGRMLEAPLSKLKDNPFQPRAEIDPQSLEELSNSIKANGVIQPVAVCRRGDDYILISGARRRRAAEIAGLQSIPAVVLEISSDEELLQLALVENLQREDLNPIELAAGYQRLIEECGLTQEEVAERVGKKRSTIANTLRLLGLPVPIQQGLRNGVISMGHARALAALEDTDVQLALYNRIIKEGMNVRKIEKLASGIAKSVDKGKPLEPETNPYLADIEERLRKSLATKVCINSRGKKGGVIEISYFSDEELERLIEIIENVFYA